MRYLLTWWRVDLSEPAERIRQLEADNARLSDKLSMMGDRSSRLTRDVTDFRSLWSRDILSPGRTQRLEEDCRNLQRKVVRHYTFQLKMHGKAQRVALPARLHNSRITGPNFTRFLADVEGSFAVLMRVSILRSSIR